MAAAGRPGAAMDRRGCRRPAERKSKRSSNVRCVERSSGKCIPSMNACIRVSFISIIRSEKYITSVVIVCLECLERQWGWRKDESRAQQRAGNRGCPTCNIALGPQPFLSVMYVINYDCFFWHYSAFFNCVFEIVFWGRNDR